MSKQAFVVSIANQKGGVGKTTTAVNLSVGVAKLGYRVLLIDADPQANASSGFGLRINSKDPSFADFFTGEISNLPIMRPFVNIDLWVSPSHRKLASVEWTSGKSSFQNEKFLSQAIQEIRKDFDIIFFDCPPSLGLITVNCIVGSDAVLIPLQCEYYALEGLSFLLDTIRRIKTRWNPFLRINGIVFTMFDRRNNLSHQVVQEIQSASPFYVYKTTIPRNVRLGEAPSHGLPAVIYDPHCPGSKAYLELSKEFTKRLGA
ncbi:MAG: ParA family protein [Thermodesulforhabdaceae bacterium]